MDKRKIKKLINQKALDDLLVEVREDQRMLSHLRIRLGQELKKYIAGKANDFLAYDMAVKALESRMREKNGEVCDDN